MTVIQIRISPDAERRFAERSTRTGRPVTEIIEEIVEDAAHPLTWAEAFKPMQDAMSGHGMSEEESLRFWQDELDAARVDRRASSAPTRSTSADANGEQVAR